MNFTYYNALANAIQAVRLDDRNADIFALVGELAQYVANNPPDSSYLIKFKDLIKLGMDLSFFLDQEYVVYPLGLEDGEAVEPDIEVVREQALAEAAQEVVGEQAAVDEVHLE